MESGRVALVTGGSRGIGRAIALKLAKRVETVLINHYDTDENNAQETIRLLESLGVNAKSYKFDVSDFNETKEYIASMEKEFGSIRILINNAGITKDVLLMRMKEVDFDIVIKVNLKGTFNCTNAVIRQMMKQRYGRIVNISSVVGVIGNAGQSNYAASKAGIIGFSKSVAKEVASRNITVNVVAPGFIETEMTENLPEKVKQAFLDQIPLGRSGKPEDVAGVVDFLVSPAADYLTGQVIHVSGGMFM